MCLYVQTKPSLSIAWRKVVYSLKGRRWQVGSPISSTAMDLLGRFSRVWAKALMGIQALEAGGVVVMVNGLSRIILG